MSVVKDNVKIFRPYVLAFPSWFPGAGFDKGIHHDRQSLGITLPAGASISVRRLGSVDRVLELDLLNDGGLTETYIRLTGEWTRVTVDHASVPFIRTPCAPMTVDIEYSTVGETILPTYIPGGDADLFLQQWQQTGSAFALIQTTYASLLVPAVDKARVEELQRTEGLDSLEKYYNGLFEFFNGLAGISFDTLVGTDRNVGNRYFIKADKDGGGYAYYGGGWTAQTANTIADCWLDTRADNWCSLHEIGHGYQTLAMYNSSIPTGEVWNNIYANFYQHEFMGDSIFDRGWLYSGGAQRTFDTMRSRIDGAVPVSSWFVHELLFLFMIMIDNVGKSAFVEFNQYYRKLVSEEGFNFYDHPLVDMLIGRWADRMNIDLGALMTLVGAKVSHSRILKNVYGNFQPSCPLYRVVPPERLAEIQQRLNLNTPLSLVDCKSLQVTDLKGDLTLVLTDQDYIDSQNKSFMLRTGSNQSHSVKITSPTLELKALPIGVYTLQHPSVPRGVRIGSHNYLEVRANMNTVVSLNYTFIQGTSLASQSIDFLGLGDGRFATLSIDMKLRVATFSVLNSEPHSYFGETLYAGVSVTDINGFLLFDLSLPGKGALVSVHEFPIGVGCTVTVHHKEPSRLSELPRLQAFIDAAAIDNVLEITSQGLRNMSLDNQPGNNLKTRIALAADELRETPHLLLHAGGGACNGRSGGD